MEYSIYNRDLTAEETRGATFNNPIAPTERLQDGREEFDKHVVACEGDRCTLPQKAASNETAK